MTNSKIPNIIYADENTIIGFLNTHQQFLNFKVENQYCIKNPRRFEAYQRAGFSLYLIDNGLNEPFLRYAILMIKRGTGTKTYWGMDDLPMNESGQREFENSLSTDGLSFINNLCNQLQKENVLHHSLKTKGEKCYIRLSESQLRIIIEEVVKNMLY